MSTHKTLETLNVEFEKLQARYAGAIEIVPTSFDRKKVEANGISRPDNFGFVDLTAPVKDLLVFAGRVVLVPAPDRKSFNPAVITTRAGKAQLSRLDQPYHPKTGLSKGILFGLGLKTETSRSEFGSHTRAGGLESGHFAPVLIAGIDTQAKKTIMELGDRGTHSVGEEFGGVPEKMVQQRMIDVPLRTTPLRIDDVRPIPIFWHPSLASGEGMALAIFNGDATKLMLGAASSALGPEVVDRVGDMINQSVRGYGEK